MNLTTSAIIHKVGVHAKASGPVVVRTMKITLLHEFDDLIAAALGPDAKKARASLKTGGMEKVVLPIGTLDVDGKFTAGPGDHVRIGTMRGLKAVGKAPKEGDEELGPTIQLQFECAWNEEAWVFLGRNATGACEVEFREKQMKLVAVGDSEGAPAQ